MSSILPQGSVSLCDAMYELSLAEAAPTAELLDQIVRRYPEHAVALTNFAVELAVDALAPEVDAPSAAGAQPGTSPAVAKAMSRFNNRLYAAKVAEVARAGTFEVAAENPFASLDRNSLRSIGQRLNANNVFVMKLRDRQIKAETMTDGFQRRVAEEMRVPAEVIAAHFAAQTQIQSHAHFKADQKPEVGAKQTFEEAVRTSGLTLEQQAYLLSL